MLTKSNIILKIVVTLGVAAFVICGAQESKSSQAISKGFSYVGSFIHSVTQESSRYYKSHNNAEWEAAREDCKEIFGTISDLVYIETQEELGNLTAYLDDSGDAASLYWAGGKFDVNTSQWTWANGIPFESWVPWDENHPDLNTSVSKVSLRTVDGLKFRSRFNTDTARFICEIKMGDIIGPEPEPCEEESNLVILIDSSWSINYANVRNIKKNSFKSSLDFSAKLTHTWMGFPRSRVSVVVYSDSADTLFGLDTNLTRQEMSDQIQNASYYSGSSSLNLGLDKALEELRKIPAPPNPVQRTVVLMTDGGVDKDKKDSTVKALEKITEDGIRIVCVGSGVVINWNDLISMAEGKKDQVFKQEQFDELIQLLKQESSSACGK